jgi:Tfp pilus assembly protein PilX
MHKRQSGQIIIIALVFMAVVSTVIVALVGYAGVQIRSHRQAVARTQALSIAEAGIEAAIWKLNNQPGYTGESNSSYGSGTYNITITNLSGSSKLIRADAFVPNQSNPRGKRSIQVTATIGTTNIGFNYGVQAGEGGFQMDQNSTVNGNIYSNGSIIGANGATIDGDAIVAGATGKIDAVRINGNSWSHFIEDSTVGGNASHYDLIRTTVTANASVYSMSNCTINGNATYTTQFGCSIAGSQSTPNNNVPPDPSAEPLPIDDEQINGWEQEAENGGVLGSQTINGSVSLGPKKINGNIFISNGSTLTITGTLWITGNLTIDNNAILRLSPSYGSLSGVIVVGQEGSSTAGTISVYNNAQINGSGTSGSYLMLLSQKTGTATPAITIENNAAGAIYYAGTGQINLSNNGGGKEITAYKVFIDNNAVVTYESGLANANFSSGPGGGWEVADQTWQLLN